MGRKSVAPSALPRGVELVGGSIRVRFTWNKRRYCETLGFPPTAQGIEAASSLRSTVIQLTKLGLMTEKKYVELFPETRLFRDIPAAHQTFGVFAQKYLDGLQVAPGSRRNYRSMLNRYWMPKLATVPLDQITPALLSTVLAELKFKSDTSRREVISTLRRAFNHAVEIELLERNPAEKLKLPRVMRKEVDPFDRDEADAIIAHLYSAPETELFGAYFELAFYTGMRPSELAALRWDEVNTKKRVAYVCRIVADGKVTDRVKNKKPRMVLLNDRALHALAEARRLSDERIRQSRRFAKGPYVFPHPKELAAHMMNSKLTDNVFQDTLVELGIRRRPQYNARHTYATMCIMAGMNPAFVAKQLGHTEKVMFDRYATWIDGQANWGEMAKLMALANPVEKGKETREFGTKVVQLPASLS